MLFYLHKIIEIKYANYVYNINILIEIHYLCIQTN